MQGRVYNVRGSLSCSSPNVIYIVSCKICKDQYIASATDFKARLRIHKSDMKTKKDRCVTASHISSKCCDSSNGNIFLRVQSKEFLHLEGKLLEQKKYC